MNKPIYLRGRREQVPPQPGRALISYLFHAIVINEKGRTGNIRQHFFILGEHGEQANLFKGKKGTGAPSARESLNILPLSCHSNQRRRQNKEHKTTFFYFGGTW